jgi:hypothetical protein
MGDFLPHNQVKEKPNSFALTEFKDCAEFALYTHCRSFDECISSHAREHAVGDEGRGQPTGHISEAE